MAYLDRAGLERLWSHIVARLGGKVDKEEGKSLSTNDYTTDEKTKLAGIEEGATHVDYAAGQEYYTATFDGTDTLYSSYSCNLYSVTVNNGKIPLDLTDVEPIGLSLIVAFENSSEASPDNYIALRINGSNYYIVGGRNYAGGSFITKAAQPFLNNPCRIEFTLNSGYTTDSVWRGLWAVPGGYSNYTSGGTSFSNAVAVSKGGTGATTKSGARTNLGITSGTSLPSTGSNGDIFFLY